MEAAEAAIAASKVLVAQLEIPLATVECAAATASKHGVPFILDPAPARALSDELLGMVDVLKPNETEAEILTGTKVVDGASAKVAAALAGGKDMREAPLFANKVAALSVTQMGAQSSMPTLAEVEAFGG